MRHPNRERLDAMFRGDAYAGLLGAEVVSWDGGGAVIRWTPREEHANFAGTVHGGAIFSLADIAFAVSSNSWGRVCVALAVEIQYLASPTFGEELLARSQERSRTRRVASYGIDVLDRDDTLVASFHALVHRTDRWHFGAEAWPDEWRAEY